MFRKRLSAIHAQLVRVKPIWCVRVLSVMREEGDNCARFFENILFLFQQGTTPGVPLLFFLFLFQQGTTPGVPLLFFFFTFSTGYHSWCTSAVFPFSFSTGYHSWCTSAVFLFQFFNRVPLLVYLCCFSFSLSQHFFTDLSIFWEQIF
jgi:hypothetical protein